MPEVHARLALQNQRVQLHVLAPLGSWIGCGTLRVLRLKMNGIVRATLRLGMSRTNRWPDRRGAFRGVSVSSSQACAGHPGTVPRHVAIIMDGNRRWAQEHGLPAIEGHRRGMIALRQVTRAASDLGHRRAHGLRLFDRELESRRSRNLAALRALRALRAQRADRTAAQQRAGAGDRRVGVASAPRRATRSPTFRRRRRPARACS